jgi:hypothetical protein
MAECADVFPHVAVLLLMPPFPDMACGKRPTRGAKRHATTCQHDNEDEP